MRTGIRPPLFLAAVGVLLAAGTATAQSIETASPAPTGHRADAGAVSKIATDPSGPTDAVTAAGRLAPPASNAIAPLPAAPSGYGGQIVLADLGGLAVGATLIYPTKSAWPIVLSWSLASPVVHGFHGHPERSMLSLLLHVGLPVLGALAGAATTNCPRVADDDSDPFCGLGPTLMGGLVGMIAATAIDAAVLAQPGGDSHRTVASAGGTASAPAVSVGRNGDFTVGWRGTF